MTDPLVEKIRTLGIIVRQKERLPLGNKDRGKFVETEKGRRAIFVPSFGVLEKEEVDYLVEVAQGQEDDRLKNKPISQQKGELEQVAQAMLDTPVGKRAKTGREIIEGNRR